MKNLTDMLNIGSEMDRKLKSIDVNTPEKLIQMGSKEAYFQLKLLYPEICLVHLYTLQGAIDNIPYNGLSESTKADLKAFSDKLK